MIKNLWQRETEFVNVINTMECRGVLIDVPMCRREIAIGESRTKNILEELSPYNPGSPKDLRFLLLEMLKLPPSGEMTPKGEHSTNKKAMEHYDAVLTKRNDPTAQKILEYRGWQKASGYYKSYLEKISPDGRIRPHYWVHGTTSGRLSCREPNLQQIPRKSEHIWNNRMKEVFLPPEGYGLLNVDFGQLEFRLAAAYSGETVLLDAFNDSTGKRHVFREMSAALNRDYTQCKTFTYATLYGAQAKKIGEILGLDPDDAAKFGEDFHNRYPRLMEFSKRVNHTAATRGYIKYWSGRRRHFPDRRDARKAFNALLQGGGAEVVKSAMIRVMKNVDKEGYYRMLLQVHDSIVGEAKMSEIEEIKARVIEEMTRVTDEYDFGVTFTAEADFWGPKIAA